MKNLMLIVVATFFLIGADGIQHSPTKTANPSNCLELSGPEKIAGNCCATQGGVCGCNSGKVVCCSGAISNDCACNKESDTKVTM